jgi:ketosteroid isomerase-like protein
MPRVGDVRLEGDEPMTEVEDLDAAIERYHEAAADFVRGDPEPYKAMFSHRDDVTLGNPFGPFSRGWDQVAATMDRAASLYRDGGILGFEEVARHVSPDLAYIAELERFSARIAGREESSLVTLRTTSVLRPEDGRWKVVHRHADPITSTRPPESVIET